MATAPMKTTDTVATESKAPVFAGTYFAAVGRRKSAVARVRLYDKGTGEWVINGKPLTTYVGSASSRDMVTSPLKITSTLDTFNISVLVAGGGSRAQAEAMRHGISRALMLYNADLRKALKAAGFLTRDPREVERKKPGFTKARRSPQFSKR